MTRREALALLLLSACGGGAKAPPASAPGPSLKLSPAVALVPAAGLSWLVEARPRELLAHPALLLAVARIAPDERWDAFTRRHGGVDLRAATELVVAGFPETVLSIALAFVDPARVEAAFRARALAVDARAVEGGVVRAWGTVGMAREQVAIFGHEGVALEQGRFGPLRAAEYFAEGKLHRARPALGADPLARAASLLGDAPLRAFAPGPFEGGWARGLGGLLRAATAVAGSVTPEDHAPHGALGLRVVLTGAWGDDALAAAERLRAGVDVLTSDPLCRLLGLDRPLDGPRIRAGSDALSLEITLDPRALGEGLHTATGAAIDEVMRL